MINSRMMIKKKKKKIHIWDIEEKPGI